MGSKRKFIIFVHLLFLASNYSLSQTVWKGPPVSFVKPDNADWTQPEFQDSLSPNVILARTQSHSLFNIVLESEYNTVSDSSPVDTEWAIGSTDDLASLTFHTWKVANDGRIKPKIDEKLVVHLITDDIYFDLTYTSWSGGMNGGYSYTRSSDLPHLDIGSTIKILNLDTISTSNYGFVLDNNNHMAVQHLPAMLLSQLTKDDTKSNLFPSKIFNKTIVSSGIDFILEGSMRCFPMDTVTGNNYALVYHADSTLAVQDISMAMMVNVDDMKMEKKEKSSFQTNLSFLPLMEIEGKVRIAKADTITGQSHIVVVKTDGTLALQNISSF